MICRGIDLRLYRGRGQRINRHGGIGSGEGF